MNTDTEAYEFLLASNKAAFDAGDYDTAYHMLAAALHLAQATSDYDKLARISEIALQQNVEIDATEPDYHHSTKSVRKRGSNNRSIYTKLSSQANIAGQMVRTKKGQLPKPLMRDSHQ